MQINGMFSNVNNKENVVFDLCIEENDFAKFCVFKGNDTSLSSAIRFLEKKFKISYDQSVGGDIFKGLLILTPDNHHFKSLGHNPTLLGLFFSNLNQFTNTLSFVADEK